LPAKAIGNLAAMLRYDANHTIRFMIYAAVLALFWRQMERHPSATAAGKIGL